ncbi:hypothetical protein SAY87_013289 [Trapa incisa]|uniref:Reticulon-like protein n=1 Tax=Trapa incisa TaxID=236973 RepID=A0AAN7KGW6_9MYRT|nr:hypothetical protein SAY87_013289 [Trapa incisa]
MPIYSSSDSDNSLHKGSTRLFGRQRPLHETLGGGKVADVLLWKDKAVSGWMLIGATLIWFLFEVAEYHFITLMCHVILVLMFIIFIWSNIAPLVQRDPPRAHEFLLSESSCKYAFSKVNSILVKLYDLSCGRDWKLFFAVIGFLWVLSIVGNYVNSHNLLYFVFICLETLPALYERYEREVDYMAERGSQDVKKLYNKFDSRVLAKIPRGPVKEKRHK